jgi:hypothetical protein
MAYKSKKRKTVKKYQYHTSENEIKYRILMNPDVEERDKMRAAIRENMGYCTCKTEKTPANRCLCEDFLNKSREGWCECKLYKKVLRDSESQEAYRKGIEFDDDADDKRAAKAERAEAATKPPVEDFE